MGGCGMKKIIIFIVLFAALLALSPDLNSQVIVTYQDYGSWFYFNFGFITDQTFDFRFWAWYLGINGDFHFGNVLMLSPEFNLITHRFRFNVFVLEPAVLLNLKLADFFFGAGIQKYWIISGGQDQWTAFGLKLNAGFRSGWSRIAFFATTPFNNLFEDMLIGLQVGFGW